MSHLLRDAIRRKKQQSIDPNSADGIKAYMGDIAARRAEELFAQVVEELRSKAMKEIEKLQGIASTIKKGDKGEPGKSIVGPAGPQGKSIQGPTGKPGTNGIGEKGEKGEPGKDGNNITKAELLAKINEINNGIQISTIAGLETWLKNLQAAIREAKKGGGKMTHGGGMTLTAGSNVTLTRNSDGTWTVAATGGGSSIATEKLTPTANGSDITLDLTTLAHTFTNILFVTRNGEILMPSGNANLPGSSWSRVTNTVTVYNADDTDIYLVQYTY